MKVAPTATLESPHTPTMLVTTSVQLNITGVERYSHLWARDAKEPGATPYVVAVRPLLNSNTGHARGCVAFQLRRQTAHAL